MCSLQMAAFEWILCWTGNPFFHHYIKIVICLLVGFTQVPHDEEVCPKDLFPRVGLDDLWEDAKMSEVLQYLHGGKGNKLPEEWRKLILI